MITVRSFSDEVKALEEYGHDCCARIDDKIRECCERIKKAHEDEVAAVDIALRLKELQDFGYDVLGNERHKTVCELRKSDFTLYTPEQFVETLYKMLYMTGGTPTNIYVTQKAVRDKLIHLLGGDLKEDDDGVDTGRCVNADSGSPDVPAAECDGDCIHHQDVQGLAPITEELRDAMEHYCNFKDKNRVQLGEREFDQLCDSIDAVHNGLERENKELRQRTMYPAESERINMLEREVKRLTAECKTQRNNFDQVTSAREHWKSLYEQTLEQIHDLEHNVEMWRDRAEDMRMERDDALKERHAWAPESHYVMLPKDRDGVPIHVGDVVVEDGCGVPYKVMSLKLFEDCWDVGECGMNPNLCRHYHAPTVEDVLREFVSEFNRDDTELCDEEIIERFAAKLRLAGDADE